MWNREAMTWLLSFGIRRVKTRSLPWSIQVHHLLESKKRELGCVARPWAGEKNMVLCRTNEEATEGEQENYLCNMEL